MKNLGESIEDIISKTVDSVLENVRNVDRSNSLIMPNSTYIATDNLGEVIEKLAIIHIRMWMLEDAIQTASSNEEIAELKRKCDICFKVKRPKYVQAINALVEDAITNNKSLKEDSVKLYKGINDE